MENESKQERNLRLCKAELENFLGRKGERPIASFLVFDITNRWNINGDTTNSILSELGWEKDGDKLKPIPKPVVEGEEEKRLIVEFVPPRQIIVPVIPEVSYKSTNFNSDGQAVNKER